MTTKDRLDTFKAKNAAGEEFTVVKTYDDWAENPREVSEYYSHFYTFERGRYSPDSHRYASAEEWADDNGFDMGNSPEDLINSMAKRGYVALPVWRYEHSAVSYAAEDSNPYHCPWDSGMVGIIYASREEIRKALNVKKVTASIITTVKNTFIAEVDEYSHYANGDVYEYDVYDDKGQFTESIGNFYTDDYPAEDVCSLIGLTLVN